MEMDLMIVFKTIMTNLPSLICLSVAGLCAWKDKDPHVWGWFLFVGFILAGMVGNFF